MRLFRRIDALVMSTVIAATMLAWMVFLAIDLMSVMADAMEDVGVGDYTWWTALQYAAFTLPRRSHELFPFGLLLGTLLGLGSLAATSELTAMRAAGVSKLRISFSAVLAAALMLMPVLWIGEVLGPAGERRAHALIASASAEGMDVGVWSGIWAREGQRYFNARRGVVMDQAGQSQVRLDDVRIYEFLEDGSLESLYVAANGSHGSGGWLLSDLVRTRFTDQGIVVERYETLQWQSQIQPEQLRLGLVRPRYLALQQIIEGMQFMRENQLDAQAWEAAYWLRLFYPVSSLALVLLAVPFAFGTLRSGGAGKRLFLGMVIAIGFYLLQRTVVDVAEVYRLNLALANALPPLLAATVAMIYFRRN